MTGNTAVKEKTHIIFLKQWLPHICIRLKSMPILFRVAFSVYIKQENAKMTNAYAETSVMPSNISLKNFE